MCKKGETYKLYTSFFFVAIETHKMIFRTNERAEGAAGRPIGKGLASQTTSRTDHRVNLIEGKNYATYNGSLIVLSAHEYEGKSRFCISSRVSGWVLQKHE